MEVSSSSTTTPIKKLKKRKKDDSELKVHFIENIANHDLWSNTELLGLKKEVDDEVDVAVDIYDV